MDPAEGKLGSRGIAQGVRSGKGLARVRQISRRISRNPNLPPYLPLREGNPGCLCLALSAMPWRSHSTMFSVRSV